MKRCRCKVQARLMVHRHPRPKAPKQEQNRSRRPSLPTPSQRLPQGVGPNELVSRSGVRRAQHPDERADGIQAIAKPSSVRHAGFVFLARSAQNGIWDRMAATASSIDGDTSASRAPADAPTSFETIIRELGQMVEQLERGDLPLEQSLDLFERGVRLSKEAQARLDAAERRVEVLLGFDDAAEPITREIEEPSAPR